MSKFRYLHSTLFILTLLTTTIAGAEWIYGMSFYYHFDKMTFNHFLQGFWYSIPFLAFLTFHEFGHYFMAKFKNIEVSLPYYIPAWFVIFTTIGTFGAFIKIKEQIKSREDYFDIGIAGPLAGFVVALLVLICGFYFMPTDDYIFKIHPEYLKLSGNYRDYLNAAPNPGEALVLGKSLIYNLIESIFGNKTLTPHAYELTHYPLIVAGFLGLLFTAINLLPIGQLDGGHILYALIGKKAFDIVSPIFLVLFVSYSGLGMFKVTEFNLSITNENGTFILQFAFFIFFNYLCFSKIFKNKLHNAIIALLVVSVQLLLSKYFPNFIGYSGFLAFGFLIGRFLGVYHPETLDEKPLDKPRIVLGWLALLIFILCFSPNPIN
jgi:membrane-associated protease RseP (regulator of RpoE activity)